MIDDRTYIPGASNDFFSEEAYKARMAAYIKGVRKYRLKESEQMEDISATFSMLVGEREGERLTLPITNEMMIDMGVDIETLKETAQNNMANQDYSFKSMREVLLDSMFPDGVPENNPMVDMLLPPEDPNMAMYVLSNNGNIYGAAEIMNQKAMDEIAEKLGGDFVVLPSSVHETIILPLNEDMDCNTLDSMIQEINAGVLDEKDKLSDHAFQYDSENHELVRMDKMQERKQEKEVEKSVEAKAEIKAEKGQKSLMDRISSKKEEVAKKEATKPQPSKKRDVALS